jgi:PAS domain S-box-containing protein
MTEILYEPGAGAEDVAEVLRALSGRLAADTPVLALGGRRAVRAGQAVFASGAILRLFSAATLEALAEILARGAASSGASGEGAAATGGVLAAGRLAHLAATLPLNGPARLERLRFEGAGAACAVTFLCRRLAVAGAPPLFAAAALDAPSPPAAQEATHGKVSPAAQKQAAESSAGSGPMRFLWRTDAGGVLIEAGPHLRDLAGAGQGLAGLRLTDAIAGFDAAAAAGLAQRLARRESFSGVQILWPAAGSPVRVPVTLAGAPGFDARHGFTGYRGFGVMRVAPPAAGTRYAGAAPLIEAPRPVGQAASCAGFSAEERAVFDALPIGLLISSDGAAVFANRWLIEALGCADFTDAEAAGAFEPILRRLLHLAEGQAMGEAMGEAIELRGAGGADAALRMRCAGVVRGVRRFDIVSLEPRTEAARAPDAEPRQHQREARELGAILDTAMDGVLVLDGDGRIVALNRSGEALFGYDRAEVAGEPFTTLIAPESRARAESYFAGLKSDKVASLLNDGREISGITRQGGAIPLFLTLARIGAGDASGEAARYCALLRDMTHWKTVERDLDAARREAERASALKSDFLAKVSHEIRTPLNAVLGFAEVMMEERFGPIGNARYKDYLKDIHSSGALVLSLVNDLLDLSKIEAGKLDLAFESVDANAIVTECVSIMQPQASAARVVMRLSLAPQLPHVCADQRAMRQIVLNLLSNAIKFTQPGGQVIISTALTDANCAALRIRDTGIGMSDDDLKIALEPFRQVASSRQAGGAGPGTGLGLPLTKALVEANRAAFSISSKVDEGTLVEVVFPPARVVAART